MNDDVKKVFLVFATSYGGTDFEPEVFEDRSMAEKFKNALEESERLHIVHLTESHVIGKVDGRSSGHRKCGKCGGSGHNRRTCRG